MQTEPERILFVKLSAMGDIVHAMPAAMDIKRSFPKAQMHWVVQQEFADLLEGHPAVDRVIAIPKRPSWSELLRLRRQLRESMYDVAMDMQGLFKSARIVALSRAETKLGFHWQREGAMFFSKPIRSDEEHVVDQYRAVAKAVGADSIVTEFGLKPTAACVERAEQLLAPIANRSRRLAINVGSAKAEKQWPVERFVELIQLLLADGVAPFFIGGPSDVEACATVNAKLETPILSLAGKTTLSELVAVLDCADLHIGGDTGSTHIAVALGKQVVCMMGPTKPERSGPYRRPSSVLYKGPDRLSKITAAEVFGLALNQF